MSTNPTPHLHRRTLLTAGLAAWACPWTLWLQAQAADLRRQNKALIVLFMQGAPSQLETFDPKPQHENGGPTKAISTAIPGIQLAADWPKTAAMLNDIAIIRSMTNKEGNHQRAAYQIRTGYLPTGSIKHPNLGASVAEQLAQRDFELPSVVTIGGERAGGPGAGYLGVDYEPFHVANPGKLPDNVASPVDTARLQRRLSLLNALESNFRQQGGAAVVSDHQAMYHKASRMVTSSLTKTFDLSSEPESLKREYGDTEFGRGCLLARRLVEAGSAYVEVRLGNWDTHFENFSRTSELAAQCDPAFAALIQDLKSRGRLESTVVVWMGEFGRTPKINPRSGRDHFPRAFNAAIAGGNVRGGRVIGSTTADGMEVAHRPVTIPDLLQSICQGVGADAQREHLSALGRPMKVVEGGAAVKELFS